MLRINKQEQEFRVKNWCKLISLLLIGLSTQGLYYAQWNNVGTVTVSDGWTTHNQIACKSDGTPVIAYTRQNTGFCKIWNNQSWVQLGDELSEWNVGSVYDVQIDKLNRVIVAFEDIVNERVGIIRYSSSEWTQVGTDPLFSGFVSEMAIAIDTANSIWCALITPQGFELHKEVGGMWELQNTTGLPSNFGLIDMTFNNVGQLIMAFTDVNALKGNVVRLNTSNWEFIGGQNYTNGFAQNNRVVVTDNGDIYHGFDLNMIHINKFNTDTQQWSQAILPGFGSNITGIWDMKTDEYNTVFIATSQIASDKARCFRVSGTFWEQLGSTGVSDGVAGYTEIGVANGQLYMIYNDFDLSAAVVKKYDGLLAITENDKGINVYPNPFKDKIMFSLEGDSLFNGNVKIYSIVGELVFDSHLSVDVSTFDLSLPAGSYVVLIQTENGCHVRQIIKQ
jgi:hypothetical protein